MLAPHTTPDTPAPTTPSGLPLQDALLQLCEAVIPLWQRHLETAQDHAEMAVSEMLSAFAEIHPSLQGHLQQQAERMMVGLQYQDRISQMMALLSTDMQRLQQTMAAPGTDAEALSSTAWLARLEAGYAMAAQRNAHHESDGGDGTDKPRPDAEPDFF